MKRILAKYFGRTFPIQLEIENSYNEEVLRASLSREKLCRRFEDQFRRFDESPVQKRNGPVSCRNRRLQAAVMAAHCDTRRNLIGSK